MTRRQMRLAPSRIFGPGEVGWSCSPEYGLGGRHPVPWAVGLAELAADWLGVVVAVALWLGHEPVSQFGVHEAAGVVAGSDGVCCGVVDGLVGGVLGLAVVGLGLGLGLFRTVSLGLITGVENGVSPP